MARLFGFLALFCLALMMAKYIARLTKNKRVNEYFWKLHKPASGILFLAVIGHVWCIWGYLRSFNIVQIFLGAMIVLVSLLLIALCHLQKDMKTKMFWHRLLSIVIVVLIAGHIACFYIF